MLKLLDIFPSSIWFAIVIALVSFYGLQAVRMASVKAQLTTTTKDLALAKTAAAERAKTVAQLTAAAWEKASLVEQKMAKASKENLDAIKKEQAASAVALAAARADARGLRDAITRFASSEACAAPADPTLGLAPGSRAVALGELLAACSDEATEDAGELETFGTQVRGLKARDAGIQKGQAEYFKWTIEERHP